MAPEATAKEKRAGKRAYQLTSALTVDRDRDGCIDGLNLKLRGRAPARRITRRSVVVSGYKVDRVQTRRSATRLTVRVREKRTPDGDARPRVKLRPRGGRASGVSALRSADGIRPVLLGVKAGSRADRQLVLTRWSEPVDASGTHLSGVVNLTRPASRLQGWLAAGAAAEVRVLTLAASGTKGSLVSQPGYPLLPTLRDRRGNPALPLSAPLLLRAETGQAPSGWQVPSLPKKPGQPSKPTAPTTPATPPQDPYPAQPLVSARPLGSFVDSVGVNTHLGWLDTAYADFSTVRARLREAGIKHIRDGACAACGWHNERLRALRAEGVKANLVVGDPRNKNGTIEANLASIRDDIGGVAESLEGPNEWDMAGDSNWAANLRDYQARLYRAAKADPTLARLPVYGPTLVQRDSRDKLGDISTSVDRGNIHPYDGGGLPGENIPGELDLASKNSAAKPMVASEAGYHSALKTNSGFLPTSERAIASYVPRLYLEYYRRGIERTFLYQLADDLPEAENKNPEAHFGLLRSDLSPKPSFLALRNLMRAIGANEGAATQTGSLRFGIEGGDPDLRTLLFRTADGSMSLVLWRNVSVWDRMQRLDLSPVSRVSDVVLGQKVSLAQRFDPVQSDQARERWANPRRIPVEVGSDPVVLRLTP